MYDFSLFSSASKTNELRDAINKSKLNFLVNLRNIWILVNNILNVDDTSTIKSLIEEGIINMSVRFDDGQIPIDIAAAKGNKFHWVLFFMFKWSFRTGLATSSRYK